MKELLDVVTHSRQTFIDQLFKSEVMAPYALEEKDAEIARAEGLWKTQFLEACKRMAKPSQPVNE